MIKTNTSGYNGVSFETTAQKWRAYYGFGGKKYKLGYFSDFNDAVKARKEIDEILSFDDNKSIVIKYVMWQLKEPTLTYDFCFQGLVNAMIMYDWSKKEQFLSFANKFIKGYVHHYDYSERTQKLIESSKIKNDRVMMNWLNGHSIREIANQEKVQIKEVSEYLKNKIRYYEKEIKGR